MSDFPKAVARVSEGFCALCDGELRRADTLVVEIPSGEERTENPRGACLDCGVDLWLENLEDGRVMLRTSRALTKHEIQKLYDREDPES